VQDGFAEPLQSSGTIVIDNSKQEDFSASFGLKKLVRRLRASEFQGA
jgi:hypothetical protein